jgi:DNA-directed RNA polymerase specialized sigma subunit
VRGLLSLIIGNSRPIDPATQIQYSYRAIHICETLNSVNGNAFMDLATSEIANNLGTSTKRTVWAQHLLESLDDQTRQILRQYYAHGRTVEQISAELGIPTLKIRGAISNAKDLTARAMGVRYRPA